MKRPTNAKSTRGRISRMLCTTTATILCFDKETKNNTEVAVTLEGEVANENVIAAARKHKAYDVGRYVALDVVSTKIDSALYAISVSDFVKYAERIEVDTNN